MWNLPLKNPNPEESKQIDGCHIGGLTKDLQSLFPTLSHGHPQQTLQQLWPIPLFPQTSGPKENSDPKTKDFSLDLVYHTVLLWNGEGIFKCSCKCKSVSC